MTVTPAPSKLIRFMQTLVIIVYGVLTTVGAFNGGMWAIGGIAMAVLLMAASWRLERRFPRPDPHLSILVAATLAVIAGLNLLSSNASVSWHLWINLVTIYVPLIFLTAPQIQARVFNARVFPVMPILLVTGAVAMGLELHSDGVLLQLAKGAKASLTEYNRSMGFLVLMAFPVLAGLWNSSRRWMIVPVILVLLWPTGLTESRTAKLALVLGLALSVAAAWLPIVVRRVLPFFALLLPAWPFAARWCFRNHYDLVAQLPPSWVARTEIWDYLSYRIAEHPLLGWGLGTAHTLDYSTPDSAKVVYIHMGASHPHNVFTELWVELGLPGVVLGLAFIFITLRHITQMDARIRPFAYGAWIAGLCMVLVGFDFWSDAIMACFALTALAFAGLERHLRSGLFVTAVDRRRGAADNPDHAQ